MEDRRRKELGGIGGQKVLLQVSQSPSAQRVGVADFVGGGGHRRGAEAAREFLRR